ncbi:uncharacterized protein RHOBADRAFT_49763 [Rhodotorula graminis WP1]|uniref:nicotinate phosphoribosyltransferase n=1 Tax=Rhodotorula graminis (strain WP1) TaxID=578459 RepID=A0A194S2R2_RHOGW|nr:uncharacterized protein RHOBADRAFT_49763 [Rhodotorula graminis WP1]KPV74795.1 hypothetical protein RHOBADRAFT_49763 [Rhodotorula graminis WP1]
MAALSPDPGSYIQSILDTDLYKLRQYAILELYPDVDVKYRFTNRGGTRFTRDMHAAVSKAIQHLETLSLTPAERAFLERRCPYFPPSYLDYLSSFRFRPSSQVRLTFVPLESESDPEGEWGSFELEVEGTWLETILYEVPLMSIISEAYFTHVDTHWDYVYPDGSLGIALTDTFTTKPFFDDFVANPERARRWKGLRQDSGDPLKFIPVAKEAFERVGADPAKKVVVFSDSLDVERCIKLKKAADAAGIGSSFGVGTHLTNDFRRVDEPVLQDEPGAGPVRTEGESSKALNMVIKLYSIAGQPCVKISDELTKNTGDPEAVALVKQRFGLEAHGGEPTDSRWGPTV